MNTTIPKRCAELVVLHGGLRKAAQACGIDIGYFSRLASGEKDNPTGKTLHRLGLIKTVVYMLAAPAPEADQPAPESPEAGQGEGVLPALQVGRLPTLNQDDYPALGDWWVQLWAGDEVFARVYGPSPDDARRRATEAARRLASAQQQCCMCGRHFDAREQSEGGGSDGAQLTDGRWTCSAGCWERASAQQPSAPAAGEGVEG